MTITGYNAGSAAFNLLIISAVCIIAVPEGETKSISEFLVFIWYDLRAHPP